MIVDAHTHVAADDQQRYPRRLGGFGSRWWAQPGHGIGSLLATMDAAGVERAVVVQAVGVYGDDCSYAIAAIDEAPHRLALVVSVDLHADDPLTSLLAQAADAPIAGLRLFGVDGRPTTWLADGRADAIVGMAAERGWTIVPTLFADDLEALGRLVERHPQVPIALDHAGFPDLSGGLPFPAAGPLLALAELPTVSLKVSTHLLESADAVGDPAALVDLLAERFGPERLCWGSDHPQSEGLDYAGKLAFARRAARYLDPPSSEALFASTAERLWFGAQR